MQSKVSGACKERQKKKFDALLARQNSPQKHDDRHVVNLSSKQLTGPQVSALSKGLNFAPTPKCVPKALIVASVEAAITQSKANENLATKARMGVIGALSRARLPPRNILPTKMKAVRELARDKDVIILPADKGRSTVVMDHSDYSSKMRALLSDHDTYQPVAKDPTSGLERRMNSVLWSLRQKSLLSDGTYRRLRSSAGGVPRLYGLPKIHKPDVPLRPIVSFVLSPTYELSKFLASLLSPCVGLTDHHVKNSGQFARFITSQTLADTDVLVSFDVVSLFTRVPTARALQVSRDRLENDPTLAERTCLSVDNICDLLSLCLDATYLTFEGKVYRQIHGTAMGSPVSVVVANLVMEDIEQKALSTFHTPPRFWRRYVDDTCTALPLDVVDSLHQHLNSVDPSIQFTVEKENGGQLPFLDILLSRESDGSISTSVYRKATHTDQYLNFQSHHPVAHKRAVVRTLMCRAEGLSSSAVSRVAEEKHVVEALQRNGYPKGFIHKQTRPRTDQASQKDNETRANLTLPYISGLSESIRRILSPLSIQVSFRPLKTLKQVLVHPKDPVPASRRKGVVYSIPCAECPRTYIGQTGRSLDLRLQEHRRALKNADVAASAVAEHLFEAGHRFDLSKASVIDSHPHTQTRCLLESWHIQHHQAPLNRERGPLPGLYATMLSD